MPVIVISYNVKQSHILAEAFLDRQWPNPPDAICLQEAGQRQYSHFKQNLHCYETDGYRNDPCAVVTVLKDRASAHRSLDIQAGLVNNRSSMLVRLREPRLVIVNVHLTSGNHISAGMELDYIFQILSTYEYRQNPVLIIGDFNHAPHTPNGWAWVRGPVHSSGNYLDWAMARGVTSLTLFDVVNYGRSDHQPFGVTVTI